MERIKIIGIMREDISIMPPLEFAELFLKNILMNLAMKDGANDMAEDAMRCDAFEICPDDLLTDIEANPFRMFNPDLVQGLASLLRMSPNDIYSKVKMGISEYRKSQEKKR